MLWDRCSLGKRKILHCTLQQIFVFSSRQQTRFQNMLSELVWEVSALLAEGEIRDPYLKRARSKLYTLLLNQLKFVLFKSSTLLHIIVQF